MPHRKYRADRRRWAVQFSIGVVNVITLVAIILVMLIQQGTWIDG